jgi:hypothetical protein
MNFQKACKVLDLDDNNVINLNEIKQKYKIYALKYHPDKNNSTNATERFQEINAAYQYLSNHYQENIEGNNLFEANMTYSNILFTFLKTIIPVDKDTDIINIIIQKISKVCESKSVDFLEKLDKGLLIKIFKVIKKNKEIFNISDDYIQLIENIINTKTKDDEIIIINPTLDDLFNNNLYRLTLSNESYIIPLWHHELTYDNNGRDVYVKCNPILPADIELDDSNNIHIYRTFNINDIWGKDTIEINVYNRIYKIETKKITLQPNQEVYIPNSGISRVNTKNMLDISTLSAVFIHIQLEL